MDMGHRPEALATKHGNDKGNGGFGPRASTAKAEAMAGAVAGYGTAIQEALSSRFTTLPKTTRASADAPAMTTKTSQM
jgi:hypothetical protein